MDAQITDEEWEAQRKRNKLLHDCKTKGFARLNELGHLNGGIKIKKDKAAPNYSPLEFAQLASKMVNEGMSLTKACSQFGRESGDLRHYCKKFGIQLNRKQREWDYAATFPKLQRLVNRQGYRLKTAARKLNGSPALMMRVIESHGYKYDSKTVKIRKVKKK